MYCFHAGLEARIFKNIETSRQIFETAVKKFGKYFQVWSEYTTIERLFF